MAAFQTFWPRRFLSQSGYEPTSAVVVCCWLGWCGRTAVALTHFSATAWILGSSVVVILRPPFSSAVHVGAPAHSLSASSLRTYQTKWGATQVWLTSAPWNRVTGSCLAASKSACVNVPHVSWQRDASFSIRSRMKLRRTTTSESAGTTRLPLSSRTALRSRS